MLEYQELRIFTELDEITNAGLNIEVFSLGAYSNPTQSGDYLRSVIPKGKFYPQLYAISMQCDKDNIHPELINWADVIISMHNSKIPGQRFEQPWICQNWKKFQDMNKKVVWRSIGQSTPAIEEELKPYKEKGLKIVRYSPKEEKIPKYIGADAIIRFSESSDEWKDWVGEKQQVITIAQSFKKRGQHLGYHVYEKVVADFKHKVFGTENENLGEFNGGLVSFHELQNELRLNRVFFYLGTQPAPYTLSFIEAMMTGIPVVSIGPKLWDTVYKWGTYEIPDIIKNGVNGFYSDDIGELRHYIKILLENRERAIQIGMEGRKTAIQYFERTERMKEWKEFFTKI